MAIDRSTPPLVSDFGDISLNVPEPITLSNGMKMWIASNREEEINKLSIYMTGGAFQESRPTQATACSIAVFNGNKEMNYAEIADMLYLSPITIRDSHSKALIELEKVFEIP